MNVLPCTRAPCECELPGDFHTGVPGILAAMEDGRVAPQAIVERCDQCCRFDSDAAALARLVELGLADAAVVKAAKPFTVHLFAGIRVTFSGVLASGSASGRTRICERMLDIFIEFPLGYRCGRRR